ncbi:hypothetical protein E8E12_007276 [Didymella heteroderae]|uniref:Uncharacterized protein n=1 Tax=Didymella heteroderae TaxID=1769908 RepID=A0A9P4WNI5_9PLEO|nr:hypothetical protein E8E12_007276 [Didymella heteroderae]
MKSHHTKQEPDWYISVDFGTTFTTVAFYRRGTPIERIHTIDNFPGEKQHNQTHRQIPTEIWYPKKDAYPFGLIKQRDNRMRFGNEVHRMAEGDEGVDVRKIYDDADRISMMKLLLDKSDYAQASKQRLQKTLESIKAKGHIDEDEDIFFHFFREIFRASKTRLGSDFDEKSIVEVTFCVPVCYSPSAVAVLGAQVERAMHDVQFGTDGQSPCNIFVVHEAEAQAMRALTESLNELDRGETFVLADCGGGTLDIGIYTVALTEPLRLGSEVNEPMAMVGAGDLNDGFRSLVKSILCKELYLENGDVTIHSIISAEVMFKFENDTKRSFQYKDTEETYSFRIRGLRKSRSDDRIQENFLVLTYEDIWNIFRLTVKEIGSMIEDAVMNAKTTGYMVSKIVIVGGFGDSPCLQSYLLEKKDRIAKKLGSPLKLRFSLKNMSAISVATGATMRAVNKASGPSRIPCQSIGILRHIPCDQTEEYSADVLSQESKRNDQEGADYILNTILWVVKKDETARINFYKLDHPYNAGKTMEIGAVEFDISNLKQTIRTANRRTGETIDKAVILVELTVIDRNLEFTARWPPKPEGEVIQGSRKFFSVASAFTPGTQ